MFQSLFGTRQRQQPPARTRVQEIDAHTLQQRLNNGEDLTLIDVRTSGEYEYDGHIPGSRLLPLGALMQRAGELPKDKPVVCVCRSGARSYSACEQLGRMGFDNVINLHGGMIAWKRAGLTYN